MKRPKGKLTSLKLTALAGVDRPCQEPALAVIMKRAAQGVAKTMVVIAKQAVMTNEIEGHSHVLDLDDPSDSWSDMYSTSYATESGATSGHWHSWTFDATTGAVTISADSGHTHTITERIPSDVLAVCAARELLRARERTAAAAAMNAAPLEIADAPSDGVPSSVADEESPGKVRVTVIEARAHAAKSTQPAANPKVGSQEIQMDKDKQIADLTTKNAELEKRAGALSKMSAVAFAVFKTLAANDAETFLAKSDADQAAAADAIAKRNDEADKVVYLSKSTGDVYKAKDDQRLVEMAKRMDAQAEEIEKADVRKAAIEVLGGMPGDDATHDLIVRSLRKSGAKTEEIDKAVATLKGMKASSKIGKRAGGSNGDTPDELADSETALANLEKGLKEFCKAQSITKNLWTDGLNAFVQTDAGAALKHAVDEATAS